MREVGPLNEARIQEAVLAYRESLRRIVEWESTLVVARDRCAAADADVRRIITALREAENTSGSAYRELIEAAEGVPSSTPVPQPGIERLREANDRIVAATAEHPADSPGFLELPSGERNALIAAFNDARFVTAMEGRGFEVLAEYETGAIEWCRSCDVSPERGRDSFGDCADCGGTVSWVRSTVNPGEDV